MENFEYMHCKSYDKLFSVNYKRLGCYSKKRLYDVYGEGFEIVGEVYHDNSKDITCDIGTITLSNKAYRVRKCGTYDCKKYNIDRFIRVGENKFLALVRNKALYDYLSYIAIVLVFILAVYLVFKPN